jgi:hypothetical protein
MIFYDFKLPLIKIHFSEHENLKPLLLDSINSIQLDSYHKPESLNKITKTDWHIPRYIVRNYVEIIQPALIDNLNQVYSLLKHDNWTISNFWFQQYEKNDEHDWHQHRGMSYTNVYYLEHTKNTPDTQIRDFISEEIIDIDVTEGDIIIFPAISWHRSSPNQSNDKKTIIAFNVF